MCHTYSQAWWWECHGLGLLECCRCWRVIFHWGKYELQHVLWNTEAELDLLPPETWSQDSVPAWQWPQTHLQDDHCFTEEAEVKGDGLAKHVSWVEPKKTSLGDPQAEGGGAQSQISASSATSSCRSGWAFQWLPVKLW